MQKFNLTHLLIFINQLVASTIIFRGGKTMMMPDDDIIEARYKKGKPEPDLRSKYEEAVTDIRDNPRRIIRYQEIFRKILELLADSHGELSISHEKVCFMREGTPLTDFGAIPLRIIKKHYVDRTNDDVELLIIGQGKPH